VTPLIALINLAVQAAVYLIFAAILIAMIGQTVRPRWISHPVARGVRTAGLALCEPFRRLMERFGVPTRPLDFSPMIAVFCIQLARDMVVRLLLSL